MNIRLILFALSLLLFAVSLWAEGDAFDVQLYDTYYIIGWGILLRGAGLLSCLTGVFCYLRNRQISRF